MGKHLCDSVLNLDHWFWRRWCLKEHSILSLMAIVFSGADLFVLIW